MTRTELATLVIAAYGALLSTILGVTQLLRGSRGIAVQCRIAIAALPAGASEFVVVEAVNKRSRPVTIAAAGLRMNNGHCFTQISSNLGSNPFPKYLLFSESVQFNFDLSEIERVVAGNRTRKLRLTAAFVRDAEGKEWTSGRPKILKDKGLAK